MFKDDIEHGVWRLTTTGMLARSSNMGAMLTAEKIGREKLYDYLQKFGIGQPTGLGIQGESRGHARRRSDQWNDTTAATVPFGQGLSVNAMQATSVFATIANNGVRVDPSLVKSTTRARRHRRARARAQDASRRVGEDRVARCAR